MISVVSYRMVAPYLGEMEAGEKFQTVESAEDRADEKKTENGSSSSSGRVHKESENLSDTLTEGVMETIAAAMDSIQSCTIKHVS